MTARDSACINHGEAVLEENQQLRGVAPVSERSRLFSTSLLDFAREFAAAKQVIHLFSVKQVFCYSFHLLPLFLFLDIFTYFLVIIRIAGMHWGRTLGLTIPVWWAEYSKMNFYTVHLIPIRWKNKVK